MIKRPEGLVVEKVDLIFNNQPYDRLEVDLKHINSGKGSSRRTQFEIFEIIQVATSILSNELVQPSGVKSYENGTCFYYIISGFFQSKKFKVVFCICDDRPSSIGIMTLFRVR